MFTQTVTRPKLQTAVLKFFVDEDYCFEQEIALANSAAGLTPVGLFDVGLIVGKVADAAPGAGVATGGNTGNGTMGATTGQLGIQVGVYNIEFIAATKFNVHDPVGNFIGEGATGVAFATQVGFTITAGGTAFVAGDSWNITVAAGSGKVVPLSLTAVDGSAVPVGVVVRQQMVPSGADAPVVLVERLAILLSDGLIFPAGASTPQKTAIRAQLAALGLIVRDS
jgi:hypothetical protein